MFAFAVGVALPAQAGGPLELVNNQPVVYPNGGTALTLNVDQGTLGTRTNAQALALVQNAIGLWNGVGTSTMRLAIGPQLAADYTTANYTNVLGKYSDGLDPVVFDTDGSLTDLIFGAGAKSSVLGFAGSAYWTSGPSAGKFAEGQSVLNGYIPISDASWTVVLAHEFGHFFGLDHSQLDSTQGLAGNNYALMYPIAYRTLMSLHEDDVVAVSTLYPTANIASTYGQLSGTFTSAGGAPLLGINIWAKEIVTGKVYSVVSDFLMQGNGYFKLLLPAGTYTLHAESIHTSFNGGSGVGPYSSTASGISFQSPNPITPVALGGGSAQQIAIIAGCAASATFRLDGTGSVTGNCASLSPTTTTLASSANPALAGASVALTATSAGTAPTGNVNFKDGGTTISGCGAVALTGAGNTKTAVCNSATLVAGVHSIVAAYGGDAANAASSNTALAQVINAGPSSPVLANAVSRKAHGAAGTFDLPLSLTPSTPTTEPRQGPGATVVMTFNKPIASASATVTEGTALVGSTTISGNNVIVGLTGVVNAKYTRVSLANVASTDGGAGGSGSVRIGFLLGDVNGNRNVSLSDLLWVDAALSQPVSASTFLRDVNLSGSLSLSDELLVDAQLTRSLPAP